MQHYTLIKPNTKHREAVLESSDDTLIVYTKAPAVEGKANAAAIKLLAEHFKVPKNHVTLIRGHGSKYKVFEINT